MGWREYTQEKDWQEIDALEARVAKLEGWLRKIRDYKTPLITDEYEHYLSKTLKDIREMAKAALAEEEEETKEFSGEAS